MREGKQAPPSLDFKTVPSERGWALLKVRSAKQFVAHLFNSDDEIGPIENELNTPAPPPSVLKQDEFENLDDTTDERSYETALEILTQRQQRVQVCNVELEQLAISQANDLTIANNQINDLGEDFDPHSSQHEDLANNRNILADAVSLTTRLLAQLALFCCAR